MTPVPKQTNSLARAADRGDRYTASVGIGNDLGEVRWNLPKTEWEPTGGVKVTWTYDPRDALDPGDARHLIDAVAVALKQMDEVREAVWRCP